MKKKLSTVLLALAAFMPMTAQNLVKGDYGYLYCHMSDKGEWTAYAISRDGYNYQDINGGNPIFNPEEHARIEGGTRDAYITRMYNGKGYIMVTTDMCVRKSHKWDNYGIDLLKSKDLKTGPALPSISARVCRTSAMLPQPSLHTKTGAPSTVFGHLRSSGILTTVGKTAKKAVT